MRGSLGLVAGLAALLGGPGCNLIADIQEGVLVAAGGAGGGGGTTGGGGAGGAGGGGAAPCADGDENSCYSGPAGTRGIGACQGGLQSCMDGRWGPCEGSVLPAQEICDGQDNDCNGKVDEGCPCSMGDSCFPFPAPAMPGAGKCQSGVVVCEDGQFKECLGVIGPEPEMCNGQDDDCNGKVDDVDGVGKSCTTGMPGVCASGTKQCGAGTVVCAQNQPASSEYCDGLDNDCDGVVDNLPPAGCDATITDQDGDQITCDGVTTCAGGLEICAKKLLFFDDFHDLTGGWSFGPEWGVGPATAGSLPPVGHADPGVDHSPTLDNGVAGVVIGGNLVGSVAPSYMTSKAIDTAGFGTLYLSYWRWLNAHGQDETPHTVEISKDNGASWQPLWVNTGPIYESQWTLMVHDISAFAGGSVRVRFGFARLVPGEAVSGWNIDDVSVATCPPG